MNKSYFWTIAAIAMIVVVVGVCLYLSPKPGDVCQKEGSKVIGKWDSGAHSGRPGTLSYTELVCSSGRWTLQFAP